MLYAGDLPPDAKYQKWTGLSFSKHDSRHIYHDITQPFPLSDGCIDGFQSEDVFEHIYVEKIVAIVNEIYRILKPGANFRLSLPDYRCDILCERAIKDGDGNIVFDPGGGGRFIDGQVVGGGHVWFPVFEKVKKIIEQTLFTNVNYLHYYNELGEPITNAIDYSLGFVMRTPDNDERVRDPYRPMSIVIDLRK